MGLPKDIYDAAGGINGILAAFGGGAKAFGQELASQLLGSFESKLKSGGLSKLDIGAKDFSPFGSIQYWDDIYSTIKDTNKSIGISGTLGNNVEDSFRGALNDAVNLGLKFSDIAEEYKAFIQNVGRNRELTSDEMTKLAEVKAVYGEGAAEIFGAFDNLGISIRDTSKALQKSAKEANKLGINTSKIIKELKNNFDAINKFTFRDGSRGLEKMAQMAVQTKISMDAALGLSDKIWKEGIEGAIEMGSKLQVLGGSFAEMGDPTQLFYQARNDPKAFMKNIQDAAKSMAVFNKETGEIEYNALGMSMLREASETLGVSLSEMAQAGRIGRKEMEMTALFDSNIRGAKDFEDILTKVSGAANWDKDMQDWVVNIKGAKTRISELSKDMVGELSVIPEGATDEDVYQKLTTSNETLVNVLNKLITTLKLRVIPTELYDSTDANLGTGARDLRQRIASGEVNSVEWVKSFMEETAIKMGETLTIAVNGTWGQLATRLSTNGMETLTVGVSTLVSLLIEGVKKAFNIAWEYISTSIDAWWEQSSIKNAIFDPMTNVVNTFSDVVGTFGTWVSALNPFEGTSNIIDSTLSNQTTLNPIDSIGNPINTKPMGFNKELDKLPTSRFISYNEREYKNEAPSVLNNVTRTISLDFGGGNIVTEEFTSKQWSAIGDFVVKIVNKDAGNKNVKPRRL